MFNSRPSESSISASLSTSAIQPLMRQVYLWMGLGMLLTAGIAWATTSTALRSVIMNPVVLIGAFIGQIGIVLALSFFLRKMSPMVAALCFFAYAGITGLTLSLVLMAYSAGTVATAFLTTAGMFGAMTIYAFTTKNDLTRIGSYLTMGLIGLVIAMVVNIFLGSSVLDLAISVVGVVIFVGLTAYDTQRIARTAAELGARTDDDAQRFAIYGALQLYLDFINLFLFMVRILGGGSRR
jgi:FtsH-binding integral membrane protein